MHTRRKIVCQKENNVTFSPITIILLCFSMKLWMSDWSVGKFGVQVGKMGLQVGIFRPQVGIEKKMNYDYERQLHI